MACVQTPLFPLALLHQQRKKKTLSISTGQVMSRGGLKFRYFLFHSLKQYFSKTLISSLKSRRYFFALLRRAKASARRTWVGVERQTRAAFLSRDAGTWGLTKNSKMAANSGFLPRF